MSNFKTISFKSTPDNWKKEYLGIKRNTVRVFNSNKDKDDIRFDILQRYVFNGEWLLKVEIVNTETDESFIREVTDVTLYQSIFIISW